MAALAPFIEPIAEAPERPLGHYVALPDLDFEPPSDTQAAIPDSGSIEREIARRGLLLASEKEISEDLRFFVEDLADKLIDHPEDAPIRVDPYFLLAAQRALIGALRALDSDDPASARRQLRIRLEQLRQVYRDLAEGAAIYEERPAKEVARWLDQALDVSQARLAELLGVSARTFQRWVSESDQVAPEGEDARRLRVIATAANHLRHVLTGPGVVHWFEQPNPQVDGRRPLDLLEQPEAAGQLTTLAASTRSHTAV
jgi:uncharacterized protein (DUF2384 family)